MVLDFIMTINDDASIPEEEEIVEEVKEVKNKKQPKTKKDKKAKNESKEADNKKRDEPADGFADEFAFDAQDDSLTKAFHILEFDEAKNDLKIRKNNNTSIDEKIQLRLAQKQMKGKNQELDGEDDEEDEHSGDEEEEDSDEAEGSEDEDQEEVNESSDDDSEEETEEQKKKKKEFFSEETFEEEVAETFATMNLSRPIMKGISQLGFVSPTPIQAKSIPMALMGKDICGGAVTGSGKTAAFTIPILERLLYRPRSSPVSRVLILCPTRELAIQCHNVATKLAAFTDITFCLAVGGLSLKAQQAALKKKPDVVIATPGRLIDHIHNANAFSLDQIEILVMDEADRMLEDGFADELNEIVKACPKGRQTMLFSATMTDNVDQLIRMSLNRPVRLMVDPGKSTAKRLIQEFVRIRAHREDDRAAILAALCTKTFKRNTIIFFRSKAAAHQMKIVFGLLGLSAAELHGNLTQEQRMQALEEFRDDKVAFLLATDIAARGLDIKGISTVINYNMPTQFAQYLHRIGRTARAGRAGRAVTLVGEGDRKILKMAMKYSSKDKIKQRVVDAKLIDKYNTKVQSLQAEIKDILEEEKTEKELRVAEMQVNRTHNILTHKEEIMSKPARQWFQDKKKKRPAKKASSEE